MSRVFPFEDAKKTQIIISKIHQYTKEKQVLKEKNGGSRGKIEEDINYKLTKSFSVYHLLFQKKLFLPHRLYHSKCRRETEVYKQQYESYLSILQTTNKTSTR
jgi:hypothetical protein